MISFQVVLDVLTTLLIFRIPEPDCRLLSENNAQLFILWKYATSEYAVQSVTFGVYDSSDIPERELVSFLDTYNQKGKDNFGHDFNDTETIVCDLGSIQNGVLVNHTDGNLFFSKFGPDTSTSLVPIN